MVMGVFATAYVDAPTDINMQSKHVATELLVVRDMRIMWVVLAACDETLGWDDNPSIAIQIKAGIVIPACARSGLRNYSGNACWPSMVNAAVTPSAPPPG